MSVPCVICIFVLFTGRDSPTQMRRPIGGLDEGAGEAPPVEQVQQEAEIRRRC